MTSRKESEVYEVGLEPSTWQRWRATLHVLMAAAMRRQAVTTSPTDAQVSMTDAHLKEPLVYCEWPQPDPKLSSSNSALLGSAVSMRSMKVSMPADGFLTVNVRLALKALRRSALCDISPYLPDCTRPVVVLMRRNTIDNRT